MRLFQKRDKRVAKSNTKIFCISMQRSGTTSVGDFLDKMGFRTARWTDSIKNNWTQKWYDGDFEAIFLSEDFLNNEAFEDDPWWLPEFYKVLYHRFSDAKFILFIRDSDDWFNSMLKHSGGKNPGNTKRHCKIYRRETEYYRNFDLKENFNPSETEIDNLLDLSEFRDHYKMIYEMRNREIVDFFNSKSPNSLFLARLEDKDKWQKLGEFLSIDVPSSFDIHSNKSR